jgi:1-deoxy-D-xylulose-5-phosphate synthase
MRFIKPLDGELVRELARTHSLLVTVEDNVVMGGAGSAVAEAIAAAGLAVPVLHLGLPDHFIDHGDQNQLLALAGLGKDGILGSIRKRLAEATPVSSIRAA